MLSVDGNYTVVVVDVGACFFSKRFMLGEIENLRVFLVLHNKGDLEIKEFALN